MPDQNAENPDVATTPIHADRHKHADPNRNPATKVHSTADKNRENQMKDCPETTVLMRLSQFHEEELFNLAEDFDSTHDPTFAHTMWWAFHDAAGAMPNQPKKKKAWRAIEEKALSNAWEKVDRANHLLADHFLHISDSRYESTDTTLSKVDGSFIPVSDREIIRPRYPNWPNIEFLVEFKTGGTKSDPFDDSPLHDPDASAKTRVAVRGQLMSYAERLFSYQHRSAVFLLLVNSDIFRVMRWDRSGVVVTEAVDYAGSVEGTKALLEVFYAYSKLSRAGRGVDTSAVRLLESSCGWKRMNLLANDCSHDLDCAEGMFDHPIHKVFQKPDSAYGSLSYDRRAHLHSDPICSCSGHKKTPPVIPVLSHIRRMFRESLVEGFPRYRLIVDGHDYLVGKHIFLGFGMVGRGTRGYVALEWKTQRFVFLKDSWRPGYAGVEREGDILAKLNANDVENVPTIVRYGDVSHTEDGWGVQETEASRFHPRRGDKKVDTTLPPFQETVAQPSGPEKKFTRFVKKAEVEPTNKSLDPRKEASDPIRQPAHAGAVPDSEGGDPPAPAEAKSAPNLPAFDPGTDVPATPPPTTGVRGTKRSYDVFLAGQKRLQGEGLRHMVHTRLVVREICLPLTAFTGSKQFVRILYECLQAHALAYTKCGYMHRDISAGNMLIYPEIVRASDGRYGVYWRGLLTDWELAKHLGTKMAMQPQRTGTWHFMSAFLLLNPTTPTTLADELEAFLHVLVYGCIRRVNSNLDSIHMFLNHYFAGGAWDPKWKQPACPMSKQQSIVDGQILKMTTREIVFSTPDGKMTKEHPLNKLISELLAIFHSRYYILDWQAAPKSKSNSAPAAKSPTNDKPALPPVWTAGMKGGPEETFGPAPPKRQQEPPRPLAPPTPEQYDNLAALESHAAIGHILHSYLSMGDRDWPSNDVVPDRQAEPHIQEAPRQEPAAVDAPKQGIDPIPEVNEQDGVLNPGVEEKDKLEGGSSAVDLTEVVRSDHEAEDPQATAHKAEQVNLDEPVVRPAKRRRKDPVVQASKTNEPAAADLTMRRVTRSRSAANVAAAAAAAAPPPPPPPPPPVAAAPSTRPVATVAQASTRVTRSKSGKLPKTNATVARAGASTSGGHTTRRGGKTRSSAGVDRTQVASGPVTRRRAAASQKTPNPNGGRRTRRS